MRTPSNDLGTNQVKLFNILKTNELLDSIVEYQMKETIKQVEKKEKEKASNSSKKINKIMLIDDDEINHLVSKKIIHHIDNQIEIIHFNEAEQALSYLKEKENTLPDLILLDIEMPKMDGWHFLEAYEKLGLDMPINMLTNSILDIDKLKAIKYDIVSGFWTKPLKKEDANILLSMN